jgi:3',5'-cyclic-AMP phosphodiesterase
MKFHVRSWFAGIVIFAVVALLSFGGQAEARDYQHFVVFSDSHLPGRIMEAKENALQHVMEWPDVDAVVVAGDLCYDTGTDAELNEAWRFFSRVNKPLYTITGNHDVMYTDANSPDGKHVRTSPAERTAKIERFVKKFNLPGAYYSKRVGEYLLIFLSVDDPNGKYLAEMSEEEVAWMRQELESNRDRKTVIFFHAPLQGTLEGANKNINTPHFIAQPQPTIESILRDNPQVRLWVSGHTHTGAINATYNSPVNLYEGRVLNVHTCDMDGRSFLSDKTPSSPRHDTVWTNSLFFYPDRIVIKTFDHKQNVWMDELTRTVR